MKGLELSEKFYREYGEPMLKAEFSGDLNKIAVGMVGHGSECFGFDDDLSSDHDFEAGFTIWIPERYDRELGFKLLRAYGRLPKTFDGVSIAKKSIFGSGSKGLHTIEEFYSFYLGRGDLPKSNAEWLAIPDTYLAEATNGKVFFDGLGEFTRIRESLLNDRPEGVRLKKLASALFYMAQAGQYNYGRCIGHGEYVAASLALTEFIKNTMNAAFLLNKRYTPYYKWTFRAMKDLPALSALSDGLERLARSPYDQKANSPIIEEICAVVVAFLKENGYTGDKGDYLEGYAYAVNGLIESGDIRNMPVML